MQLIKFIKRYLNFKKNLNLISAYCNYRRQTSNITNYPVIGYIDPIANCNLKCAGCATGLNLPDRHRGMMTIEEYKGIINEIGDYLYALSIFNWGEPTMHHDFPEMVKYASNKGIYTSVSSNFSIKLTDDYLRRIVMSGLDVMYLSIDGITQETYSKYRRGGNLETVFDNLKRIHEIKIKYNIKTPLIKWKFLVFKHNEHEIDELRQIYKLMGADELVIVGSCIPSNSDIEAPLNPLYQPLQFNKCSNTKTCSFLYGSFVYSPDKLVAPCCGLPSTKFDFSVYNGNVRESMNSDKFIKARQFFKNNIINYDNINTIDGLKLNTKLHESGIICFDCPTPFMQDGQLNILPFLLDDILTNFIKPYFSVYHQEYLRNKWYRIKKMVM